MSLCVVDGLHCRCQPPEVPCDGVVKLNAEIERMKGEIARVQSLHEGLMKNADKMNDELRAEIAALKADAERYRWLRISPNHYFPEEEMLDGDELDAAIDAILRKKEQTP